MPQTSVSAAPGKAFAGQIADTGPRFCKSCVAEGAIVAGTPVLRGTDPDRQAIAIADSDTVDATTFLGWAVLETSRPLDSGGDQIADEDTLAVLRKGRIFVQVTADVVAGNPVFVGNATAQLGDIDDATGTGLTQVPGAYFLTSASANGFAVVEQS